MKFLKLISLTLIFALVASTLTSSFGDIIPSDLQKNSATKFIETPTYTKLTKDYTIRIDEKYQRIQNQELTVTLIKRATTEQSTRIHISESMTMSPGTTSFAWISFSIPLRNTFTK